MHTFASLTEAYLHHANHRPFISGPFEQRRDLSGCNWKFRSVSDVRWLIKVNDGWLSSADLHLRRPDMNEREEFFSVLANWLGASAVPAWKVQTPCDVAIQVGRAAFIRDSVVVTEDQHAALEKPPQHLADAQADALAEMLTFCFWIGDEDRKIWDSERKPFGGDVLWLRGLPHLIDQSLSGPPTIAAPNGELTHCRGCHMQRFDRSVFPREQAIKMSPSRYPSVVAYLVRDQSRRLPETNQMLEKIESLDDRDLLDALNETGLPLIGTELLRRRDTLREDYLRWRAEVHSLLRL